MKAKPAAALVASLLAASQAISAEAEPVISEAVVAASAEAVWRAYTAREAIEDWMVAASSEFELGIGSIWRTGYEEDSDLDGEAAIHNEILAFDPGRMLAVRTVKPPADFPFPNAILETWTVLYVESVDENHTKVTTKMFGFDDTAESQEMREFFVRGNAYELEKLAEYLSAQ